MSRLVPSPCACPRRLDRGRALARGLAFGGPPAPPWGYTVQPRDARLFRRRVDMRPISKAPALAGALVCATACALAGAAFAHADGATGAATAHAAAGDA